MAHIQSNNQEFLGILGSFVQRLLSKYNVYIAPKAKNTNPKWSELETEIKTIHNRTTNHYIEVRTALCLPVNVGGLIIAQFLVPKIPTTSNPQLKNDDLLEKYLEHRHRVEPWLPIGNPKIIKKHTMELKAVISCFPLVWDEKKLLAMTMSFAVQCEIDDLIELMDVGLVQKCLIGHQRDLQEFGIIRDPKTEGIPIQMHRYKSS
jgi:hypothetical protein